jgi:hypothetical protein
VLCERAAVCPSVVVIPLIFQRGADDNIDDVLECLLGIVTFPGGESDPVGIKMVLGNLLTLEARYTALIQVAFCLLLSVCLRVFVGLC